MRSIFGVKLNYIVIFEKSCNSSTLFMELFTICDLVADYILAKVHYVFVEAVMSGRCLLHPHLNKCVTFTMAYMHSYKHAASVEEKIF